MESTDVRKTQPSSCSAIERAPEGRTRSTPDFSRRSFQQGGVQLRQASTGRVLGLHVRSPGLSNAVVVDPQNAYRWYLAGQHYQFAESNWHRLPTSVSRRRSTPIGSPAKQPSSPTGRGEQSSSTAQHPLITPPPAPVSCTTPPSCTTATGAAASVKQLAAMFTQLSVKTNCSSRASRASTPRSSHSAAGSMFKSQPSSPRCGSPALRQSGSGTCWDPGVRQTPKRSTNPQVEVTPCMKGLSGRAFFEAVAAQLQATCGPPLTSTGKHNTPSRRMSRLHSDSYCLQHVNEASYTSNTSTAPACMEAEPSFLDIVCQASERLWSYRPARLRIPSCLGSGLEAADTFTSQDQQQTAAPLVAAADASSDYSFLSFKSPGACSCHHDSCMHDEIDLLPRSDQCTPRAAYGTRALTTTDYLQHHQEERIQPLTSISCDTYVSAPCSPVLAYSGKCDVSYQNSLLGPDNCDASPTRKRHLGPADNDLSSMDNHAPDNEYHSWHSSTLQSPDLHSQFRVSSKQEQDQQRHQNDCVVYASRATTESKWQLPDATQVQTKDIAFGSISFGDECKTPFESSDLQRHLSQQVGDLQTAVASSPAAFLFEASRPGAKSVEQIDWHSRTSNNKHHGSSDSEPWHSFSSAGRRSSSNKQHRFRNASLKQSLTSSYEQSDSDNDEAACGSAVPMSPASVFSDYFSAGSDIGTPPPTRRPSAEYCSPSSPVQQQRALRVGLNGHSPRSSVAGSDSWYSCYTDWHSANEDFSVPTSPHAFSILIPNDSWQAVGPVAGTVDPGKLEATWEGKPACVIQ